MIVSDLKAYIEEHGTTSRSTLAKHFALSEDGVEAMLEVWVKKGKITKITSTDKSGETTDVKYRIVDTKGIPLNVVF